MASNNSSFRMKTTHKFLQTNNVSTNGSEKKSNINLFHLLDDSKGVNFLDAQYTSSQFLQQEKPKSGSGFYLRSVPTAMSDHM